MDTALHAAIRHTIHTQWQAAGMPGTPALNAAALQLAGDGAAYPSGFQVDVAAAASVAASTLATAQLAAMCGGGAAPAASVQVAHALA